MGLTTEWLRSLLPDAWRNRAPGKRVELRLMPYAEADRLLKAENTDWRLAPEEDDNHQLGMVYLERIDRHLVENLYPPRVTATEMSARCKSDEQHAKALATEFPYWTIKDPEGNIDHTMLYLERQEAIDEWIDMEQCVNALFNMGRAFEGKTTRCTQSWECYEAEGYSCVRVKIEEAPL